MKSLQEYLFVVGILSLFLGTIWQRNTLINISVKFTFFLITIWTIFLLLGKG